MTISVAAGGTAAQSNDLLAQAGSNLEPVGAELLLQGLVGLAVETRPPTEDPFTDPEVRTKVDSLLEKREPGTSVAMPASLTAPQRAALHSFASENGLKSISQGKKGAGRFITLSVPSEKDEGPVKAKVFHGTSVLIIGPAMFSEWCKARSSAVAGQKPS